MAMMNAGRADGGSGWGLNLANVATELAKPESESRGSIVSTPRLARRDRLVAVGTLIGSGREIALKSRIVIRLWVGRKG